eukprot:3937564-Rhodomonas_salina.1
MCIRDSPRTLSLSGCSQLRTPPPSRKLRAAAVVREGERVATQGLSRAHGWGEGELQALLSLTPLRLSAKKHLAGGA